MSTEVNICMVNTIIASPEFEKAMMAATHRVMDTKPAPPYLYQEVAQALEKIALSVFEIPESDTLLDKFVAICFQGIDWMVVATYLIHKAKKELVASRSRVDENQPGG